MISPRKRARLGDLVEVRTPRGLAYLQYTSMHPVYRDTVRVLPGLFAQRPPPDQLAALATLEGYFTFYRVGLAAKQGLVEIVGNSPIPSGLEAPSKLLRAGFRTREGQALSWWLRDGTHETLLKRALTPEEKRISLAQMWNHEFLVERLAGQWRPEHEHSERPRQENQHPEAPLGSGPPRMRHFLYFARAKESQAVAGELRERGFSAENRKSADGRRWLVLATHSPTPGDPTGRSVREDLERLAQQHSGEYDGSETELPE